MNKDQLDEIWERFVFLLSLETFGEKEVIMEGKRQKNLYGSVQSHREVFDRAAAEVLNK